MTILQVLTILTTPIRIAIVLLFMPIVIPVAFVCLIMTPKETVEDFGDLFYGLRSWVLQTGKEQ